MRLSFYETQGGADVVLDVLRSEPSAVRAHVGAKIRAAQNVGFQLGKPQIVNLQGKRYQPLRELRMPYSGQTYRLLFFHRGDEVVAVEFVGKKSRLLPTHVLETARKRMLDWNDRNPEKGQLL